MYIVAGVYCLQYKSKTVLAAAKHNSIQKQSKFLLVVSELYQVMSDVKEDLEENLTDSSHSSLRKVLVTFRIIQNVLTRHACAYSNNKNRRLTITIVMVQRSGQESRGTATGSGFVLFFCFFFLCGSTA